MKFKNFFKHLFKFFLILLLIFFIFSFLISFIISSGKTVHKSDKDLILDFQKNRPVFKKLLGMIQKDKGLLRVDSNWTSPANPSSIGITDERMNIIGIFLLSSKHQEGLTPTADLVK